MILRILIILLLSCGLSQAQLFTPVLPLNVGGGLYPFQFLSSGSTGAGTTLTYSSNLGNAAANRYIIVTASGIGNSVNVISSVTVAGNAAANISGSVTNGNSTTSIWCLNLTTGTSGNIAITVGASKDSIQAGAYAVYGLSSCTPLSTGSSTADPGVPNLATTQTNGLVISICSNNTTATFTWTNMGENYDITNNTKSTSGAYAITPSTSFNVTCTRTANSSPTAASVAF